MQEQLVTKVDIHEDMNADDSTFYMIFTDNYARKFIRVFLKPCKINLILFSDVVEIWNFLQTLILDDNIIFCNNIIGSLTFCLLYSGSYEGQFHQNVMFFSNVPKSIQPTFQNCRMLKFDPKIHNRITPHCLVI